MTVNLYTTSGVRTTSHEPTSLAVAVTLSPYWYMRGVTPHCRIRFPGGFGRPTTPRNGRPKTLCYFPAAGRGDHLRTDATCSCIRLVPGLATTSALRLRLLFLLSLCCAARHCLSKSSLFPT